MDYSSKKLVTLATQWMLRMVPTSKQPGVVPIGPTKYVCVCVCVGVCVCVCVCECVCVGGCECMCVGV